MEQHHLTLCESHSQIILFLSPSLSFLLRWCFDRLCPISQVFIGEQNVDNDQMWAGGHFARRFPLLHDAATGAWTIDDKEDPMFGWVRPLVCPWLSPALSGSLCSLALSALWLSLLSGSLCSLLWLSALALALALCSRLD
jgi:hypothetical protein